MLGAPVGQGNVESELQVRGRVCYLALQVRPLGGTTMRGSQAVTLLAYAALALSPSQRAAPSGSNGLRELAAVPLASLASHHVGAFGIDAPQLPREAYEALIYCALAKDDSVTVQIDGQPVVLDGWLGFAPEWKNGDCSGESCQEWVTACLLGKLNAWGLPVSILFASEYEPHRGKANPADWPFEEGSFYGNLFADVPVGYTCLGRSAKVEPLMQVFRRCAVDPAACMVTPAGDCFDIDGDGRRSCESFDEETGGFALCHGNPSGTDGSFAPTDHGYRTITVRHMRDGFCR
jgi:hypothetical protein